MLTLLRDARQAGIACRNIHPNNLLVTSSGVKLIDYGSDIIPWDESEFEQMCRRAYLTYRFPFRSDLKRLMTESLTDASLPELSGLDQFVRALDRRGLDELYYRPMADLVAAGKPASVLDYGCGDGGDPLGQRAAAVCHPVRLRVLLRRLRPAGGQRPADNPA